MITIKFWLILTTILTYFWFIHADTAEFPAQAVCLDLKAMPFKAVTPITPVTMKLWVGRVMVSASEISDPDAPGNSCSPITYGAGCLGTMISIDVREDGSRIVKTISYNDELKSVVCYEQYFDQDDSNYNIFHGTVKKLKIIDVDGNLNDYESVPQSVIDQQAKSVATVYFSPDKTYAIYLSCDLKFNDNDLRIILRQRELVRHCRMNLMLAGWVAYTEAGMAKKNDEEFRQDVDQQLINLNLKPELFIDVPTEIPLSFDQCMA